VPEAPTEDETWGVPEAVAMVEVCSAVVLAEEELSPAVAVLVPGLPYQSSQSNETSGGTKSLTYSLRL
jgi:hypothetical protein